MSIELSRLANIRSNCQSLLYPKQRLRDNTLAPIGAKYGI